MESDSTKSSLFHKTVSKRIESLGPLYAALRAGGKATFDDKKYWREPSDMLEEANALGQKVPLIFSTDSDRHYAFGWAILTNVQLKGAKQYSFANLVEFREPLHFDDLKKFDRGDGERIGARKTTSRPYNIIPTPYAKLTGTPISLETNVTDSTPKDIPSQPSSSVPITSDEIAENTKAEEHGKNSVSNESVAVSQPKDSEPMLLSSPEGKRLLKLHSKRERNPRLAKEKKRLVQAECGCLKCAVCDFDFLDRYGPHGGGFIECHHTKPLSDRLEEEETLLEDLELVCANCHRMLHRGKVMLSIAELRAMLRPTN